MNETPPDGIPEELRLASDAVKKAIADIMEHCDSVRIFVTKDGDGRGDDKATLAYNRGDGNWFAQYGQIVEWVANTQHDSNVKSSKPDEEDE